MTEKNITEDDNTNSKSPRWNSTTKLVVTFTLVALVGIFLIIYRNLIGPLMLSVITAYLMYPVADRIRKAGKLSWRLSTGLTYILIFGVLGGLLAWGGIALVEQIISLVKFIQRTLNNLPAILDQWSNLRFAIGPFELDFTQLDLNEILNQLLNAIQPIISQAGSLLGSVATGAAGTIGWMFFILIISYFLLSESLGVRNQMISFQIPGYQDDVSQLSTRLGKIWNAFLRGQLIITLITIVIYTFLLGILGVRYYYVLALLAGLARFVPYVGPAVTWATYGLVAFFQGTTLFGMEPIWYVVVVVAIAWMVDTLMDNLVVPYLLSDALKVHPAGVLVAALIGIQWFGIIAVVLAAPVLATFVLIINYAVFKLADKDPWSEMDRIAAKNFAAMGQRRKSQRRWMTIRKTIRDFGKKLINSKGEKT